MTAPPADPYAPGTAEAKDTNPSRGLAAPIGGALASRFSVMVLGAVALVPGQIAGVVNTGVATPVPVRVGQPVR
jgi:hypothetical protein